MCLEMYGLEYMPLINICMYVHIYVCMRSCVTMSKIVSVIYGRSELGWGTRTSELADAAIRRTFNYHGIL